MPESSGLPEFFQQVSGLLAFTCAAGLLWVLLMAVIVQRGAERRRRAARGEPPPPGLIAQVSGWLQSQGSKPAASPAVPALSAAPSSADALLPDLSMLTGDLPDPDPVVPAMPEPPVPAVPVEPVVAPAPLAPVLDETPDPPADSAPVEIAPVEDVPVQRAPAPLVPPPSDVLPSDAVEVLRVWRDVADGALVIEIGGQRIRSLSDLRGAELERRFRSVLRDLDAMASGPILPPPPPVTKPAAVEDEEPPKPSFLRQMSRVAMGRTPPPSEEANPVRGIAEEVEDLLQTRLENLPEYKDRSIHVKPSLHGVRIEVDDRSYDGIGDVDDPAIHALLLDVVREWENRQ
jgi:hypothetical protein